MKTRPATTRRSAARCAFTLFELLVVIAIVMVLVAVTTPAVSSLISSANYSAAVNSLTGTLGNARALAISRGARTGVVFSFDIETGDYTLQVVELAPSGSRGQLVSTTTSTTASIDASVFVPARNSTPVTLPKGTAVFGLSFVHFNPETAPLSLEGSSSPTPTRTTPWYLGEVFADPDRSAWRINPWMFPRNDPRLYIDPTRVQGNAAITLQDVWNTAAGGSFTPSYVNFSSQEAVSALRHAQSFIVMYGPDGVVVPAVDDAGQDVFNGFVELPGLPIDLNPPNVSLNAPYDLQTIFDPEAPPPPGAIAPSINPEVWIRSVDQLAVVEFTRLTRATGIDRPWLLHPSESKAPWPPFRGRAELESAPVTATDRRLDEWTRDVSQWIDLNAEIIGFDRYTGVAQRRRSEQ